MNNKNHRTSIGYNRVNHRLNPIDDRNSYRVRWGQIRMYNLRRYRYLCRGA